MSRAGLATAAAGALHLDLRDAVIGIDGIDVLVPPVRAPVSDRAPTAPWRERMGALYGAAHLEPETLAAYFAAQQRPLAARGRPWRAWVATAEEESGGDLAVGVARALLAKEPDLGAEVGLILHCQSTLDERPAWSTVCRIQHELRLRRATGFTVNQVGGASSLVALQVACQALLAEDELRTVLIVASQKVVPPQGRYFGRLAVMGDGASVMAVRRSRPSGYRIRAVSLWAARMPAEAADSGHEEKAFVARGFLALLRSVREQADGAPDALLVLPNLSRSLLRELAAEARAMGMRTCVGHVPRAGCLGSSDLAVGLQLVRRRRLVKPGGLVFAAGFGINGALGYATLSYEPS